MPIPNEELEDEKPSAPEPESITDNENIVRIKDDDDDDDSGPAPATDTERRTRKERRSEKRNASILEAREQAKQAEERARRAEERIAALERTWAAGAGRPQPEPPRAVEPESDEADELSVAMENIAYRIRSDQSLTAGGVERLTRQYRQLERKRAEALVKATVRPDQQQQQSAGMDRMAVEATILEAEFPEIFASPALQGAAKEELGRLCAAGSPPNLATARKAAQNVMNRAKRAAAPPPSATDQARHTSVPSRAGASSAGDGTYRLAPWQRNMALTYAKGRGLSDDDAMAAWVREVAIPGKLL